MFALLRRAFGYLDANDPNLRAISHFETELARIAGVHDAKKLKADPAFARAIICELSRGFRGLLTELKNQKLRTSTERLADWLLRANAQLGEAGTFTLPFDKRTLASRLGMTPFTPVLRRNVPAPAPCSEPESQVAYQVP